MTTPADLRTQAVAEGREADAAMKRGDVVAARAALSRARDLTIAALDLDLEQSKVPQ